MIRIVFLLVLAAACSPAVEPGRPDRAEPIESTDDALRRFRRDLPTPDQLSGAASWAALETTLARSLAEGDAATLDRLKLTAAEFAFLYYPSSPLSRPPYQLPPEVMWLQLTQQSGRGLSRLLHGGRLPAEPARLRCASSRPEGPNRIHVGCMLRQRTGEIPIGAILERDGRFSVLAYDEES